jgi:hypothetical protein
MMGTRHCTGTALDGLLCVCRWDGGSLQQEMVTATGIFWVIFHFCRGRVDPFCQVRQRRASLEVLLHVLECVAADTAACRSPSDTS